MKRSTKFVKLFSSCTLIYSPCKHSKTDDVTFLLKSNKGCNPNVFTYPTLMNGTCKEGKLQEANNLRNEMKIRAVNGIHLLWHAN